MRRISPHRIAAAALLLVACGPKVDADDDDSADSGVQLDAPSAVDADPFRPDALLPPANAAVYAHSSSTLYKVDPDSLIVSAIGPFQWPLTSDTMTDIAIDKDGNMIGISFNSVYAVNKDTAECTYLAALSEMFNGLSYIAVDGPDPGEAEILIGAANSGTVYQVNPTTGATTPVGAYGNGWGSSGDIVSIRGLGTLATVVEDSVATDKLAMLDTNNGFEATIIGDTGVHDIWGIGFWGNKVYGFSETTPFVLIDVTTGEATEVETSPVHWWGAGVTTSAPVID